MLIMGVHNLLSPLVLKALALQDQEPKLKTCFFLCCRQNISLDPEAQRSI